MLDFDDTRDALVDSYRGVTLVIESLSDRDFLLPTSCAGWAVGDILFHLLLDAQRALIAFTTSTDAPPDVDFVTYWRGWSSDDPDALVHAHAVRIAAASFPTTRSLVVKWTETSEAVLRAVGKAWDVAGVMTQGHVLTVPDLVATLAVEATIHHLDMTVDVAGAEPPSDAALGLVRRTLNGLLGTDLPVAWSHEEYALKGTGRLPLDACDHRTLGPLAARLPLFS